MSRKDFEAIAHILNESRHTMGVGAHSTLVSEFAEYLSTNPAFDRTRFASAAGVTSGFDFWGYAGEMFPDDFPPGE